MSFDTNTMESLKGKVIGANHVESYSLSKGI